MYCCNCMYCTVVIVCTLFDLREDQQNSARRILLDFDTQNELVFPSSLDFDENKMTVTDFTC